MREAGVEVHVHDDYFRPDARDEEWLSEVGRRGWIVLTKDKMIRYRGPELAALRRARVSAFVLTGGDLQGQEMARIFVQSLPKIMRFVKKNSPPFIAKITKSGTVSMVLK